MSAQSKTQAATEGDLPAREALHMLAQLSKADSAVRRFPEPREGLEFEQAQRVWSGVYARAIALGAKIEAEDQ